MTEEDRLPLPEASPARIASLAGLYIHIPFCVQKCPYCDFASGPAEGERRRRYLQALIQEIRTSPWQGAAPRTVFFGGGTPSELSVNEWNRVCRDLAEHFPFTRLEEFTVECNPGTLSPGKLEALRQSGVNRLSLGVQSFNDLHLCRLGRIHDAACARDSLAMARKHGFSNLSLDLMYGLPGQSLEEWQADLHEAIRFRPDHLSLYALALEPGTPYHQLDQAGKLPRIDPDRVADMFEYCMEYTLANGYRQYEISNYCLPGLEARHNLLYWTNQNYLGFGVSAASHVDGFRWANTRSQDQYVTSCLQGRPALEYREFLPAEQRAAEELILRLRLQEGADLVSLSERYELDLLNRYRTQVARLRELGLLEDAGGSSLVLSRKGRLLASEAACYFL